MAEPFVNLPTCLGVPKVRRTVGVCEQYSVVSSKGDVTEPVACAGNTREHFPRGGFPKENLRPVGYRADHFPVPGNSHLASIAFWQALQLHQMVSRPGVPDP